MKKNSQKFALTTSLIAISAIGFSSTAAAQVDDEIIVTATKRTQTLQETPVAVSVTGREEIERAQIIDISDLQSVVPSLRVTQLQTATNTSFSIRGFGNGANGTGIEPSVGIFIDGVYRSRAAAAIGDLPNLERVEVLRGPQSTLFGKNASAGVISVVTSAPSFESGGYIDATYGNYDQKILRGYFSGGNAAETFAASIGGSWNKRDGYAENGASAGSPDLNDRDRWGLRGQLLFRPADNIDLRVIADISKIDENCCVTNHLTNTGAGALIRGLGGEISDSDDLFSYRAFYDEAPAGTVDDAGISFHADVDFNFATLTSISAYRSNERFYSLDVDFSSGDFLDNGDLGTDIETFTQELRLTSAGDNTVDWMIGGFVFEESISEFSNIGLGSAFRTYVNTLVGGALPFVEGAFMLPSGTIFNDSVLNTEFSDQDNSSYSLLGSLDWKINDQLTASGGLNYTDDSKRVSLRQINQDVFSNLDLSGTPLAGLSAVQFLPRIVEFPNSVENGRTNGDKLTWTARLAYEVNNNINVYANAATGFKASSWNLSRDSRPFPEDQLALENAGLTQNNQTYGTRFAGPEESTVYELGLKARFERGAINLAVFDQTIEGFQSSIFVGTGFVLANAGKQSAKGIEVDSTFTPVDPLTLTFAATLLDPVFDDFQGAQGVGGPVDLSGTKPAGIHEVSLSTSATYNHDFGNGMTGFIRGDYLYESNVQVVSNVSADLAEREVNTVNASAGLSFDNGMSVKLWGRNIFNDEYLLSAFPGAAQPGIFLGYPNPPRTYGISLRQDF